MPTKKSPLAKISAASRATPARTAQKANPVAGLGKDEIWALIENGSPKTWPDLDENLEKIGHAADGHMRMRIRVEMAKNERELNAIVGEMANPGYTHAALRTLLAPRIKSRLIAFGGA